MRQRIQLYIAGSLADISEQSLVLFNYAFTEVQAPTAVKNSYSQKVTLPGTAANDAIFGHIFRLDHSVGAGFNPLQKTDFAIYNELGEILQSGYLKLEKITRAKGGTHAYQVSLYGGLGELFYGLSYGESGEKLTLADLQYIAGSDEPDAELDFNITAANVRAAWAVLAAGYQSSITSKWQVVNFAPCYEGFPDGDFEANKGYGSASSLDLTVPSGYSADAGGNVIVKLREKVDMWAAKDLRSYLQHPVLSMRAFLQAVIRKAAALGWAVDISNLPLSQYQDLWKTLPAIPSLGTFRKMNGSLVGTLSAERTLDEQVATWNLSGLSSMTGIRVDSSIAFRFNFYTSDYLGGARFDSGDGTGIACFFVQMLAYSGATLCGGSDVLVIGPDTCAFSQVDLITAVESAHYVPAWATQNYHYYGCQPVAFESGGFRIPGDIVINTSATSVTKFVLRVTAGLFGGSFVGSINSFNSASGWDADHCLPPTLWKADGTVLSSPDEALVEDGSAGNIFNYSSPSSPRSGAALGKATLLQSSHTPAEYLISLAKQFGWVFLTDTATRTVQIMRRNLFFNTGEDALDLSDRVDRSKEISINPLNVAAKWYTFKQGMAEGAFAKEYASVYGFDYGEQRINTGYEFDADEVNLLAGSAFRAAACVLARGRYWNYVQRSSAYRPSMFLFAGNQYSLKANVDGSEKDFDVAALPDTVTVNYYNAVHHGYDLAGITRLQLEDAEGKVVSGDDILCTFCGMDTMRFFNVTDDSAAMLLANGDKPCWWLTGQLGEGENVPVFSRYVQADGVVNSSLDFGYPREVDSPDIAFGQGVSMYERYWQAYLSDLFHYDTKVMTCRVDFHGIQVGPELLRRFFWYDGSLWVLNKIKNYSLTTWDPVECEFVQVQDTDNYTNGQSA